MKIFLSILLIAVLSILISGVSGLYAAAADGTVNIAVDGKSSISVNGSEVKRDNRARSVNNSISNEQCLELDILLFKDNKIRDID